MKKGNFVAKSRKMKKKIFAAGMAACVALTLALAGCGQEADPNSGSSRQEGNPSGVQAGQEGYEVVINGVTLGVDMDMNELASKLGEAKSVFEAPSCAAQGTAYVYSYASFEIETYPDGDKNRIAYITLKDDTVATAEGIDLSKTRADIVKAYGEASEKDDSRLTYEKGGMKLNFIFKGEDIVSIEYVSGIVG